MTQPSGTQGGVLRVAHTGIAVSDLDRAVALFTEVLGGTATEPEPMVFDDDGLRAVVGVAGAKMLVRFIALPGGHVVELLQYVSHPDAQAVAGRPFNPGHFHLAFFVKDIEAILDKMTRAGFGPVSAVQRIFEAGVKLVYTVGFDNVTIELLEWPTDQLPN